MTNQQHPITPPPELMAQWSGAWYQAQVKPVSHVEFVATQAARWGADQELEACCTWLINEGHEHEHNELRDARRPKPPSLKEQALKALTKIEDNEATYLDSSVIRRALEELPE